jgi:hypothetical protein
MHPRLARSESVERERSYVEGNYRIDVGPAPESKEPRCGSKRHAACWFCYNSHQVDFRSLYREA